MYAFVVGLFYVNALHTAANGFKQVVGVLAYHDENGMRWWFLNEFENLVGALDVHPLRQPNHRNLISSLTALKAQLTV